MTKTLKIASWNIAGGHTSQSNRQFDYDKDEDANYFVNQLLVLNADIICLQESHWHPQKSLSNRLATALKFPYVFETINSPSGIDSEFKESTAILSKIPMKEERAVCLPYPQFDMYLPDGNPAAQWDKYLQICEIQGVQVGNIHTQPMGYFKHDYHKGQGAAYAKEIEELLLSKLRQPFVLAGDFNTRKADEVFKDFYQTNQVSDALDDETPTKPSGSHIDYILHTSNSTVKESGIIKTNTDHYLCWAELSIE